MLFLFHSRYGTEGLKTEMPGDTLFIDRLMALFVIV